jgi:mono/diheme cytochrome c family protein
MRVFAVILAFASWAAWASAAFAQGQSASLTISSRDATRTLFAHDLLADPSARDLSIANDPIYREPMVYRVVPMERLLAGISLDADDYVQVRATDNFSASIPAALLKPATRTDTEAFLAIENPAVPWPAIPGKQGSAGPFYIVWQSTKAPVARTYWVYRVAALTVTDSPHKRWPNLGVPDALPASDPVWRGRDRFVALCMACHRFNGDGEGDAGPDLVTPMSPVDYFQPLALKRFLRNPSAVRSWPSQKMPGFDEATLSDADLDAIIAWLTYKKGSAPPQKAEP